MFNTIYTESSQIERGLVVVLYSDWSIVSNGLTLLGVERLLGLSGVVWGDVGSVRVRRLRLCFSTCTGVLVGNVGERFLTLVAPCGTSRSTGV